MCCNVISNNGIVRVDLNSNHVSVLTDLLRVLIDAKPLQLNGRNVEAASFELDLVSFTSGLHRQLSKSEKLN